MSKIASSSDKIIILASGSRDRRQLFDSIQVPYRVIISNFLENLNPDFTPYEQVIALARGKLLNVKDKIFSDHDLESIKTSMYLIIAADTVVVIDGEIIGKAKGKEDAICILKKLSGRTHVLMTGVSIYDSESNMYEDFVDETTVHFINLTDEDILNYITYSDEYQGRAGAYSLRERASLFIDTISGSPSNVIGLPLDKIYESLKDFGINLLKIKTQR